MSNRVARAFEEAGFKRGDTVALFMHNRPEYVAIWIGLAKIGIVTALVNNNLRDKSLLHALTIVDAKALIFEAALSEGKLLSTNVNFLLFIPVYYTSF